MLVDLKYYNGLPVIKEIKRVSKPGRRIYAKATSISKIQNGLGLAIVSTSMGIMSDNDARTKKIGGEIYIGRVGPYYYLVYIYIYIYIYATVLVARWRN